MPKWMPTANTLGENAEDELIIQSLIDHDREYSYALRERQASTRPQNLQECSSNCLGA